MNRVVRLAAVALCAVAAFSSAGQAEPPGLKQWYFAEGSTNDAWPFEEEILIANPTSTPATVQVRYLPDDGSPAIPRSHYVQPYSRYGINVRADIGSVSGVAVEVTSNVDIVVERSMYWGGGYFNFGAPPSITDMRAGHNASGVHSAGPTWYFAEGSARGAQAFQTFVLVSNPGQTDAADVTVSYLTKQGERRTEQRIVAPGSRQTFYANDALSDIPLDQVEFAIRVTSTNSVPVVAERAMYWNGGIGGHASPGTTTPSGSWFFAEGVQGPGLFDTYVLLFNPSTTTAVTAHVNFHLQNGTTQTRTVVIQPERREHVYAGEVFPTPPTGSAVAEFSISVTTDGAEPVVAERAVYRVSGNVLGDGTAAAGLATEARKWAFAEGQEGGFAQYQNPNDPDKRLFTTYYSVLNRTGAPVTVRGVFYLETDADIPAQTGLETTIVVPAGARGTFAPQLFPQLHNRKFAAFFEASAPVVMERAMYWGNNMRGAHAASGTILPDSTPTFPAPNPVPLPVIASISPNRGTPGGGTAVTITGKHFGLTAWAGGQTTVGFGGSLVPASNVTVINSNTIQLTTPPGSQGKAQILLTTSTGQAWMGDAFEYFDPWTATGQPAPIGNLIGIVADVAARFPGDLRNSCTVHDGRRVPGGTNNFMFEVVAELRRRFGNNRWGLNWKRGNVGDLSQDIVNYFYGPEGTNMRNHTSVRIYDIVASHCGNNPGPNWQDQTQATIQGGTVGRWTVDPICAAGSRFTNQQHYDGSWLFPECR